MKAQISPSLIIKTLVILLACVISGCIPFIEKKVYSGPELPKESVAIITWDCGIEIYVVDEKVVLDSTDRCKGSLNRVRLHLLPGLHEIRVHYREVIGYYHPQVTTTISSPNSIPLEFEAKAGHTYRIHSNTRSIPKQGYFWQPSIEDVTGK